MLEDGRNTKIFHHFANSHRRFNTIDNLLVDGVLTLECISQFFEEVYTEMERDDLC